MLTFREYICESGATGRAAVIGITAKVAQLNREVQQDPTATKAEKNLSGQLLWLASLVALGLWDRK